jgi:hypothetical protein
MRSIERTGWTLAVTCILACLAVCSPVNAVDPILPHIFYGDVKINTLPAPVHTSITAMVGGDVVEDYLTEVAGYYGSTELTGNKFTVQGEIEDGEAITFYINGIQAECYDVDAGGPWLTSYPFTSDDETHLNLSITGPVYFIEATAGPGGDIDPSGSVQVAEGTDRTFTISPDYCYEIEDVLVNGDSVGPVPTYTFINVTENQTINATFSEIIYTITATAHQGGSISPSGVQQVDCGDDFAFTVSPETGYLIDNVFLDGTSLGPVSGYTIYGVTKDYSVNAYFTPVTYTISASAGPNGNISPVGDVPVSHGDDETFLMLPDAGYTVGTVIVNGVTQPGSPTSYTFYNVTGDQNISVTFVEGPPEYFTTTLGDGWNIFATPIELELGHRELDEIFPPGELQNIEVFLGWDGSDWFIPGSSYQLKSRYALYVKVDGSATAYLYPLDDIPHPLPSRTLPAGWNLIGPQPFYQNGTFPTVPVEEDLISVYEGTGGVTGYTMVVSPGINQPFWIYYRDGSSEDLLPYKGYWVYMQNQGQLAGYFNPVS